VREFRFETLYSTPEIFLAGDGQPNHAGQVLLLGDENSRQKSLIGAKQKPRERFNSRKSASQRHRNESYSTKFPGEMACWVPLLAWIHETTEKSLNQEDYTDAIPFSPLKLPAVLIEERSWDFQPPDVLRPLAKVNLSDIAIIARRMGMKWKDFRPSDGVLRAEGHSHIITSTVVRSLGIVLQYSYTGQSERLKQYRQNNRSTLATGPLAAEQEEIYIPRARADRLGAGVLRGEPKLGLPDVTVSTQREIVTALRYLDRSGSSSDALSNLLRANPDFRFRIADLVAFTVKDIRHFGSRLVQVPAPSDNVDGVTTSPVGRRAFREGLEGYLKAHHGDAGSKTGECLRICQELSNNSIYWDDTTDEILRNELWVVKRDSVYLDAVQGHLWALTDLLRDMMSLQPDSQFRYSNLLGAHIKLAMFLEGGETSALRNLRPDYKADMEEYFAQLPAIIEDMKSTGVSDPCEIVDSWVIMMLRAFCWGACHFFVLGERVPVETFGSQLPVNIG
jgi:hypothetical protein